MRIGNLDSGRELTQEELTKWLIQRTRFLMGRTIPDREPGEYQQQQSEFASTLTRYESEEQKLIKQMKDQILLRDAEIERLRQNVHNVLQIMASTEDRLGQHIQENNELRKHIIEISGPLGNAAEGA